MPQLAKGCRAHLSWAQPSARPTGNGTFCRSHSHRPFPSSPTRRTQPAHTQPTDGVESVELLQKLGFTRLPAGTAFARPGLRFESYPGMGHSSCDKEIADLQTWLAAALK